MFAFYSILQVYLFCERNNQPESKKQKELKKLPLPNFAKMGNQNPWAVENIEAFSFYCCPECDFLSKDGNHFKRHAIESHKKSKVFFIVSKPENTAHKDPLEVETESGSQTKVKKPWRILMQVTLG